jgi:HEAT repeat protein
MTNTSKRSDDMDGNQRPNLDQFMIELDDLDPIIRQEAAIGLGDFCREAHPCIEVLIERLQSSDHTLHDRACAAWALGRIKLKAEQVVPILVELLEQMKDQAEADEFRHYIAEAIERLTGDIEVLTTVARHCLRDRFWECRMKGLFIVEGLLKRQAEMRDRFVPLVEPLVKDEIEEVRDRARRILAGSLGVAY